MRAMEWNGVTWTVKVKTFPFMLLPLVIQAKILSYVIGDRIKPGSVEKLNSVSGHFKRLCNTPLVYENVRDLTVDGKTTKGTVHTCTYIHTYVQYIHLLTIHSP